MGNSWIYVIPYVCVHLFLLYPVPHFSNTFKYNNRFFQHLITLIIIIMIIMIIIIIIKIVIMV